MRKLLRFLAWGAGGLVVLLLLALGVVYVLSERTARRQYDVPLTPIVVPDDSASIAEGARLASVRGCNGCHGERLEGGVFFDEPWVARIVAGNLTRVAPEYSDAELERVIRRGVKRDGRSVFGMPSGMFHQLTDADLGRIIAFVRSMPAVEGPPSALEPRLLGRIGLVAGMYRPVVADVEATAARLRREPPDTGVGAYVVHTSCTECHGPGLEGNPGGAPALSVVAAYDSAAFARLMRTGVAADGRERQLMTRVARSRFAHLTDEEVGAAYAYLRQR